MINAAALHIFDPEKPIVLKTDASKHAIGAVLEQDGVPVAFESKKMGPREQFLPAYESELLAIVYALTKWKQVIGTRPVTVETDHATLGRMLTQKQVTTRLGYWLDKLADFNLKVVYKPGKNNVVADAISRRQDLVCVLHGNPGQGAATASGDQDWTSAYEKCKDFNSRKSPESSVPRSCPGVTATHCRCYSMEGSTKFEGNSYGFATNRVGESVCPRASGVRKYCFIFTITSSPDILACRGQKWQSVVCFGGPTWMKISRVS